MVPMIAALVTCSFVVIARPKPRVRQTPINLVPTPVLAVRTAGVFRITHFTNIVFDSRYQEDAFAAGQLMEEILTDVGERIEPISKASRAAITLLRLKAPVSKNDLGQGYRLEITPAKVIVSSNTSEGIFYGVQSLKQLIRANRKQRAIPACRIADWPALTYRGWQHDISRGPIPTYDFLMKEIRTLAEFKLNMLTLYTEHVFKLAKHPTIAPDDGITAEEITELSSYAKQFHVELVGNFQSFGHFRNILKVPGYENLAETPSVLSPAKDESYKFLDDVYSEIAPAYASPLFNINCDEVSGLGNGPSKALVDQLGVGGVYAKHVNRVAGLLHKYQKTPMMWGDIALNFPDIVPKLPKDLIVLPWAYDPRPNFDSLILPFTHFGLQFIVCPGVSCWSQIWPDFDRATPNISNFIRDGARNGALGALNTEWADDGVNFFDDNWYELVWGADCSWRPSVPRKKEDPDHARTRRLDRFNREFAEVFFGLKDNAVTSAIQSLSDLRKSPISGGLQNKAFWRDPVSALSALQSPENIAPYIDDAQKILLTLQKAKTEATHNAPALDYAIFAAKRALYLGQSLASVQAMQKFNPFPMRALSKDISDLKDGYIELWQRENRQWWLDRVIAKFDDLLSRIQRLSS